MSRHRTTVSNLSTAVEPLETRRLFSALLTVKMVVDGGSFDNQAAVPVSVGQTVHYKIIARVSPVGTVNTNAEHPITISSLVPGVDGLTALGFKITQKTTDAIQVQFTDLVHFTDGFNDGPLIGNGDLTPRGNAYADLINILGDQPAGTFVGVASSNQPADVEFATGVFKVAALGNGSDSTINMGFQAGFTTGGVRFNNAAAKLNPPHYSPDTQILFKALKLTKAVGPAAALTAPTLTTGGRATYDFSVAYSSTKNIDVSTLGTGDVRVTGPNGYGYNARLQSVNSNSNGSPRSATYRITAPGGSWDAGDNGTYTVTQIAGEVADTDGVTAEAKSIGTFIVKAPAATVNVAGKLSVIGTAANDTVILSQANGILTAKVNGASRTFNASTLTSISISTLGGNDNVTVGTGVAAVSVDAGAGNDTVFGGAGRDSLTGGPGADSLVGNGGNDWFYVKDATADTINGGAGHDYAQIDSLDKTRISIESIVS